MVNSTVQAPQQPSTPANGVATPPPAAQSATPDLDALLSEFTPKPQAAPTPAPTVTEAPKPTEPPIDRTRLENVVRTVEDLSRERAKQKVDADMTAAIKAVKDAADPLSGLPDRVVKGLLYEKADTDARFLQAFMQREQHPESWSKILKSFAQEAAKDFSSEEGSKVARDRAAVTAAVSGLSTSAPTPKAQATPAEMAKWSAAKFNAYKRGLLAKR